MKDMTLTLLDAIGIQNYIFTSNRLQENIGASELVYRATTLWAFDALEKLEIRHNIRNPYDLDWSFTEDYMEANSQLDAEVIQAAGGNTLVLFREGDKAREFVKKLTLRLLKDAPGLTVVAQHLDGFDFDAEKLLDARSKLEAKMRRHKQGRFVSTPTLGLGVTAMCASTGLAAANTLGGRMKIEGEIQPLGLEGEDMNMLVSRETAAKRAWRAQANRRLKSVLKLAVDDYVFPYELDNIGRLMGEESYIAVVHADGNQMGKHVREIAENAKDNRQYITTTRKFSQQVNEASLAALKTVVAMTVQAVKNGDIPFEKDEKNRPYLPLRPLVFGGDDVTFVCNGNIGVKLAAEYLESFRREAENRKLDLHASAGVAIVKLHYPFARAYALSDDLAKSAKSLTREVNCSALDWHFAQSGLSGSLEKIREREYTVSSGELRRPITLDVWHKVEAVMETFNDSYWGEKHNKVIGLREVLRKGPRAVEKYRQDFDLRQLPEIAGPTASQTGWDGKVCYYFDAIELLDHHVALKNKERAR
jgi:hypothetical protein